MLNIPSVAGATEEQLAAYAAFVEAQQEHNATTPGDDRILAALKAGEKWKAFLRTCEGPKEEELADYKHRLAKANRDLSALRDVTKSAYAMLRGCIDIGGFDEATGEDADLSIHLIHEAHNRLRDTLRVVSF